MSDYKIECSIQTNCRATGHITGVRISGTQFTVQEIYELMGQGHRFYTEAPFSGLRAWVNKWDCACGRGTLRSSPDAVTANNLDSLIC